MLTTISSNPSSIDHWITIPTHSDQVFLQFIGKYYPHSIPLLLVCTTTEQLFRFVALPSSLLHTQQSNRSQFHHIRQAPSFSRHHPNIQTAHSHAVTVQIPHKNDIDYFREENDFHLFTGSIMDPFKTGPTRRTVCYGRRFIGKIGKVSKPTAIANRGQFPLTQRVSSQWPRFNQLRDGQQLPKTVYGESVLT